MDSTEYNAPDKGLFAGLDDETLASCLQDLKRVNYKKGGAIPLEQNGESCLYLIVKGNVEVGKALETDDLPSVPLSNLGEGEFFGELSLLSDEPHSTSVVAKTDVELLQIPRETFLQLSVSHPVVMYNLVRTLSARLRLANTRFGGLMEQMIDKNRLMAIGLTASKIIHDIKTPLTVISLTAQLVESLFPESAEYTDSILRQVKLVDELVREVLDYVKGSPIALLIHKVDLDAFLHDLKETYGASLKGREIDLIIENKCGEPVYFDSERIRRVVINLLRNSSEAMERRGEIRIITSLSSNWLQISVIDDGPGIPDSIAAELFRPFVTYGKPSGTGLGLAICNKLVTEHSGRLEYKPVEPHGSRFDIRIPQNLD